MGLEYYVDIHVLVDRLVSVEAGHQIAHNVKNVIESSNAQIADVLVHIEPATVLSVNVSYARHSVFSYVITVRTEASPR